MNKRRLSTLLLLFLPFLSFNKTFTEAEPESAASNATPTNLSVIETIFIKTFSAKNSRKKILKEELNKHISEYRPKYEKLEKKSETQKNLMEIVTAWFKKKFHPIFPGTNWCGKSNIAENYDDLGLFKDVDVCCRNHDYCMLAIKSGEIKYNLYNYGMFTRSLCECDDKFYRCLNETESIIAKKMGFLYFNIFNPQCFEEDYPRTCIKYEKHNEFHKALEDYLWLFELPYTFANCRTYNRDTSRAKVMQWRNNKLFL